MLKETIDFGWSSVAFYPLRIFHSQWDVIIAEEGLQTRTDIQPHGLQQ
jgi:hypothetical protein